MKWTKILSAAALALCCGLTPVLADDDDRAVLKANIERSVDQLGAIGYADGGDARSDPRIVGGSTVNSTVDDWHWTVSIQGPNGHFCGGSLIAPIIQQDRFIGWRTQQKDLRWIVTAAHCFFSRDRATGTYTPVDPDTLTIVSGAIDLSSGDALKHEVVDVIVHPEYDPAAMNNHKDVALVEIDTSTLTSEQWRRHKSVKLAAYDFARWLHVDKAAITVQGWGRLSEGGALSKTLQQVIVPFVDLEECATAYRKIGLPDSLTSSMFCAGYVTGGYDSCQGDSGGPATFQDSPFRRDDQVSESYLVGVVSWGKGCARSGAFGVYTDILNVRGWIEAEILKLSK